MATLKEVYRYRYIVLLWSVIELLLLSGIIFGWTSLVLVLKHEKFFHDLCDVKSVNNSSSLASGCVEQDERLNLVFTLGVLTFASCGSVAGSILDYFGPRKTRLLSCFLFGLSCLFFVSSNEERPNLIFPGMITLASGGLTLFLTVVQVTNMFSKWKSSVISLFNGALDSSAIVWLFFKLTYDGGVQLRWIFLFFYIVAIIDILGFTFVLPSYTITTERIDELCKDMPQTRVVATGEAEAPAIICEINGIFGPKWSQNAGKSVSEALDFQKNVLDSPPNPKELPTALQSDVPLQDLETACNNHVVTPLEIPQLVAATKAFDGLDKGERKLEDWDVLQIAPLSDEGKRTERQKDIVNGSATNVNPEIVSTTPGLLKLVLSAEYMLLVMYLSICSIRIAFYIGSLNSYLEYMSDNDMDTVNHYTNWFGIIQFGGFFFAPVVGFVMDWKPKKKTKDFGFVVGFVLTNIIALLLNILVLIPVLSVQYISFIVQVVLRAYAYATYAAFILHKFPMVHYGKLYGLGHVISAVFTCLQYALFTLVENLLGKDPFWINVGLLVLCLLLNVLPVFLWLKNPKKEINSAVLNTTSL